MILLAGLLLVMAYLLFSTQTALLATVGQDAGREASSALHHDFLVIRSGLAEQLKHELTDNAGDVRCPDSITNWKGRVEAMLVMLTQLESNRGQSFHGVYITAYEDEAVAADGTRFVGPELVTELQLYLSNGDGSIAEKVRFFTDCT